MGKLAGFLAGKLQDKSDEYDVAGLSGKVVLIYFSAHWCPPCRGFTPQLAEWYKKAKADGKNVEIIFVSSDRDDAGFLDYYSEMPWLALKYDQRALKDELAQEHGVRGIPMLVIVNTDGTTFDGDGRSKIAAALSSGCDTSVFDDCPKQE